MKKALSLLMTAAAVVGVTSTAAFASQFSDTKGHWAESSIDRWSGYGVVNGHGNGTFSPNANMSRAEMAQTYVNLLQLTEKADISRFTDVDPDAWYADAIARCVAAGILNGTSDTTISPQGTVDREQMFVAFGRAMGLQPVENTDSSLSDLGDVSDWAEGMVNALLEAGYVNGMEDNTLRPQADINRASVMSLMDQTVAGYGNESGSVLEMNGQKGLVLVVTDDVTVTGQVGDLVIAPGAAEGTVTLKDATVTGTVTLSAAESQLKITGETKVDNVVVNAEAQGAGVSVDKDAAVGTLSTAAENSTLSVSGKVEALTVTETADNTTVSTEKGSAIDSVTTAGSNTTVSGSGTVSKVEAAEGSSGVTVTTPGTTVENNSSSSVTTDKGTVGAGETGSTGSSSSGGSSSGGGSSSDSTQQIKTALKNAVKNADQYPYDPAYIYSGDFVVTEKGDVLTLSGAYSLTQGMDGTAMNDMARFLGALYRADNGATVKSIVYQGTVYTWANGENAVNLGSNWVKDANAAASDGNTLVSAIVDEYQSKGTISSLTLTGNNSVSITLDLVLAVKVGSAAELNAVLASPVQDIQLTASFSSSAQINVTRPVTIDGCGFTITSTNASEDAISSAGIMVSAAATIKNLTVSGPNNNPSGWDEGEYGIKIYNTTGVILEDVTVTGANAGIQVNSSEVTLAGTITVSGNEFGGIEVCKSNEEGLPAGTLHVGSASIVCTDTTGIPAIWVDGTTADEGVVTGADRLTQIVKGDQIYYYSSDIVLDEVTLSQDLTIPAGETLTVKDLTVPAGKALTVEGTLTVTGTLTVEEDGTLVNEGTINGNVSGIVVDENGNELIYSAVQLRDLANRINTTNYTGTVKLCADIDLSGENWDPIITTYGDNVTIDGQGFTISNMKVEVTSDNKGSYAAAGFIADNTAAVTVSNLIFDGAYVSVSDGGDNNQTYAGVLLGHNDGTVGEISSITVKNSTVICHWQSGGIVGYSAEDLVFDGCTVEDTFIGGSNNTCGTLFGLGITNITARNCVSQNVQLYTDNAGDSLWDQAAVTNGRYQYGSIYEYANKGKIFTDENNTVIDVTIVNEMP